MLAATLQGSELRIVRLGNTHTERLVQPTMHTAQSVDDRLQERVADHVRVADVLPLDQFDPACGARGDGRCRQASATGRSPIIAPPHRFYANCFASSVAGCVAPEPMKPDDSLGDLPLLPHEVCQRAALPAVGLTRRSHVRVRPRRPGGYASSLPPASRDRRGGAAA